MPHALIARQPIVDAQVRVRGYELLFRSQRADAGEGFDGEAATATVAINTLLDLGLRSVAGEHPVFVNMTRAFLTRELYAVLPPERVVLEVLEDVEPDAEALAAVRRARELGYRIALDDYVHGQARGALLELADVVKVDAEELDDTALAAHAELLRRPGLTLLAEKIETQERFELAREAGYELFQGWFYARPHLMRRRRLHSERASLLQLLVLLEDPRADIEAIGGLVERNPTLSYKLMRFVNSLLLHVSEPIESVRHACVMLGLERVRTCVRLLLLSEVDDKPHELMANALSRARMCQLLAPPESPADEQKFFTVGLLSLLDAFLDRPQGEVVGEVPLAADVRAAIVDGAGLAGAALRAAVACERGDWRAIEHGPRDALALQHAWLEAVAWSREVAQTLDPAAT